VFCGEWGSYMRGPYRLPSKVLLPVRRFGPRLQSFPNCVLIGSSVFAQHPDHATCDICAKGPRLRTACGRCMRSNNDGGSSAECVRDGKRIATVWCLSVCLSCFYPRDAILARVLAMALCPCQCSIKKDGQMNMLFGMKASFGHVLH